jgi:hypothetical protein
MMMADRSRTLFRRLAAGALAGAFVVALACGVVLGTNVHSGQDLVKIRNSLLVEVGQPDAYDWRPGQVPAGFILESLPPPEFFSSVAQQIIDESEVALAPWDKALLIARHLVQKEQKGGPIQKDSEQAYQLITEQGLGYCADYTQVFGALALSAGLSVREWGMSFDGYGGDGHAFNEIFDASRDKWMFIDSFNSFYVVNTAGVPVSVEELRDAIESGNVNALRLIPIVDSRFPFRSHDLAFDYYRKGLPSLFMVWGNGVFTYESHPAPRVGARISRSAEQLSAILWGVHPRLMVESDRLNVSGMEELRFFRRVLTVLSAAAMTFVVAGVALLVIQRRRRLAER